MLFKTVPTCLKSSSNATLLLAFILASFTPRAVSAAPVLVETLDLSTMMQGAGDPQVDKSMSRQPLSIDGQKFAHGIGTNAESSYVIDLMRGSSTFTASVGVDDDVNGNPKSSAEFQVLGDGKLLFDSGVMHANDPAKLVSVDTSTVNRLTLIVTDAGRGNNADHADWADATLEVTGQAPIPHDPLSDAVILTPPPGPQPRINGPAVFGVRPGSPFLYSIPVTGTRPMSFAVSGLPSGLKVDRATGRITGSMAKVGTYDIVFQARNSAGTDSKKFRIVVGEDIELTPPMGWNSWNAWGAGVDEQKLMTAAQGFIKYKLDQHGWTYVNIDDGWQGGRDVPTHALQPNPSRFANINATCDIIHAMGLKVGIYSTPWVTSYDERPGGSSQNPQGTWDTSLTKGVRNIKTLPFAIGQYHFTTPDTQQFAAWGIDYLKYDWAPNELPETKEMYDALRASGRDIVLSLSNNSTNTLFNIIGDISAVSNSWRMDGDIGDNWGSIIGEGFNNEKWAPYSRPGHWNDPDMLEIGAKGGGRRKRLTPDEQYTHISQWCLLSAPLLLGCDFDYMDKFTLGLITNDEVLNVDQDALGQQATRVSNVGGLEVFAKHMADGSRAVGLFNTTKAIAPVAVTWAELGLVGTQRVRDLWRQKDIGDFASQFQTPVNPHGVVLIQIWPASKS